MNMIVFTGTGVSGANSLSICNGIGNSSSGKVEKFIFVKYKIIKLYKYFLKIYPLSTFRFRPTPAAIRIIIIYWVPVPVSD